MSAPRQNREDARSWCDPKLLLEREQRTVGNQCGLLRFWETTVDDRTLAVIVYDHGYKTFPDMRSVRCAVYLDGRHIMGGVVS